jgi:cell division septum initiation protein DivIVA
MLFTLPLPLNSMLTVSAEEAAEAVKQATPSTTGEAKGQANEMAGQAKGKANEVAGQAKGKAAELQGYSTRMTAIRCSRKVMQE